MLPATRSQCVSTHGCPESLDWVAQPPGKCALPDPRLPVLAGALLCAAVWSADDSCRAPSWGFEVSDQPASPPRQIPAGDLRRVQLEHIERALDALDRGEPHPFGASIGYDLLARDRSYPPKAVFGIAAALALGRPVAPGDFSGGEESVAWEVLRKHGYVIKSVQRVPRRVSELDRDDPGQARQIFESLLFTDEELKKIWLDVLDEALQRCQARPMVWSLTLGVDYCRLNAGVADALSIGSNFVSFSYDSRSVSERDAAWIADHDISQDKSPFKSHQTLYRPIINRDHASEGLRRFKPAILHAIEVAMDGRLQRAIYSRAHSDGALRYLESVMGKKLPRPEHGTGQAGRSYWKIAPEVGGRLWDLWRAEGHASIGWPKLGDLRRFPDRAAFDAAREQLGDPEYDGRLGAGQVWAFRNIAVGDVVIANRGISEILGVGDVVEGYTFDSRDAEHPHRLGVRWRDVAPLRVDMQGWRRTLIEVGKADFERWFPSESGGPTPSTPSPHAAMTPTFESLLDRLDRSGLRFSEETVADFLLALQTKRFVILSGVSGTGKTRLAIEVARMLQPTVTRRVPIAAPAGAIAIEIQPYMNKYHRMVVPVDLMAELDLPVREEGSIDVLVDTPVGSELQRLYRSKTRDVSILLFRGGVRRWFEQTVKAGDVLLASVVDDGGTPHLRLSLPQTQVESQSIDNLAVIAVRPDWTDHRGLLGYFNPITEQYVTTPFLELVLRAKAEADRATAEGRNTPPFFALLDEMNLARVEHYFADFLSAMESGEPLHLHDAPVAEQGETSSGTPVPSRLHVPANLFFVGTVNIDESTCMFSNKVLDRAFTLEFNEVNLGVIADAASGTPLRLERMPDNLVPERGPLPEDWDTLVDEHADVAKLVQGLHAVLATEHRHFGYRVANEIARFVLLAVEQAGADAKDVALDLAVLHKVLPKLHGSQQDLEVILDRLLAFAVRGVEPTDADVALVRVDQGLELTGAQLRRKMDAGLATSTAGEMEASQPFLPRTAGKLFRMRRRLLRQGFASFLE
jgi:5-methylcytosine-specific restriction enzyme B